MPQESKKKQASLLPITALERVHYLYRGLQAIHKIGRLIQSESDPAQLLQKAAAALESSDAYYDVWFAVTGQGFEVLVAADSVKQKKLSSMFEEDTSLPCAQFEVGDPQETKIFVCPGSCDICPRDDKGMAVQFVAQLVYDNKRYGLMKASAPTEFSVDEHEWEILSSIAKDLSFALHVIEQKREKEAAEEALKESEDRYKTLFEGSMEGIIIVDAEQGEVLFANNAFRRMFGYKVEELKGFDIRHLHPRKAHQHISDAVEAIRGAQRTTLTDVHGRKKDGTSVYVTVNGQVMNIGGRRCAVGFYTDTTEQMARNKQLQRYSAAIHASRDTILVLSLDGGIVDANHAAASLFGYATEGMIVGQELVSFFKGDDRACVEQSWEHLTQQGFAQCQGCSMIRNGDSVRVPVETTSAVIYDDDGNATGVVSVMRDVSEQEERAVEILERTRILTSINQMFKDALQVKGVEDAASLCLKTARDLIEAEMAFLFHMNPEGRCEDLFVRGNDGLHISLADVGETDVEIPERWIPELAKSHFVSEEGLVMNLPWGKLLGDSPRSYLGALVVVISNEDDSIGVLGFVGKDAGFTTKDLAATKSIADPVAHVLMRQKAEERLQIMQEQLAASKQSFANIVERSRDGILVVDLDETVRFANPSAAHFFDTTVSRLVGQWFNARTPDGQPKEVGIMCPKGAAGTAEMAVQDTVWEDREAILVLLRDITERKRAEGAQIELNRRMRHVIGKLEELDRTKTEFIANTSHELKTPLNAIMGYISLMNDGIGGPITDKQTKWLGSMSRQSQTLLELINQILDFSKLEAGKIIIDPKPLLLEPFMFDLHSTAMSLTRDKSIEVKFSIGKGLSEITTDPQRLGQVLANLISNAAKFTDQGFIKISVEEAQDDRVLFTVADSGIGLDKADLKRIFNPFEQVDGSSTRKYRGTGLGLSIVRRLVELLEGHIRVNSVFGEGSVFTVELPKRIDKKTVDTNVAPRAEPGLRDSIF